MKRIFIVHGWGGTPQEGWFPWLKKELEKKHFYVEAPSMPETEHPRIETWIPYLTNVVGKADKDTYFVGHSIGCQTILRYLEKINTKIGGVVLVAPWLHLDEKTIREEGEESILIAKSWIKTPINFKKIKKLNKNFVAFFSDNDPFVPLSDSNIFKKQLNAKILLEKQKGHFSGSDKINQLPLVLEELLKIINNPS